MFCDISNDGVQGCITRRVQNVLFYICNIITMMFSIVLFGANVWLTVGSPTSLNTTRSLF